MEFKGRKTAKGLTGRGCVSSPFRGFQGGFNFPKCRRLAESVARVGLQLLEYLDENKSLILKIVESQNTGKLSECVKCCFARAPMKKAFRFDVFDVNGFSSNDLSIARYGYTPAFTYLYITFFVC
ncbi:hypothetical protein L3X38_037475 [Prunus dulcis]|uniref:SS18 N-terminal domain-containing protein n=1 Tax=Prunus dulcis TaxID=3755 RepID=A0AAD4YRA9_PRUDU|nr:hypothetical protein L3X38_037475 [Prunus dulcis]